MNGPDCFDRLPDPLILVIFNGVRDIKALIRCRAVSTRFNTLVPHTDSLSLRVDRVVSASGSDEDEDDDDTDDDSFLSVFVRSVFKPLYDLVSSSKRLRDPTRFQNSPSRILRGFERIRSLEIELPAGDLRLEKGAAIRWSAEFGKSLRSCVILGFRSSSAGGEAELGGGGGLKTRVVWTISALIAASARHYMVKELLREHKDLERLVVRDREGEGTVVMERDGLRECRERNEEGAAAAGTEVCGGNGVWWRSNRTTVPAVRMRMRHEPKMELHGGERMEGATLVVVRPAGTTDTEGVEEKQNGRSIGSAFEAFDGVYGEAVEKLLKSRSYLLEMNSF